jgi:hypothetical protein
MIGAMQIYRRGGWKCTSSLVRSSYGSICTAKECLLPYAPIELWEHMHCKGIFARSKLASEAIRSMHTYFYDLPDDTRLEASAHSVSIVIILNLDHDVLIDTGATMNEIVLQILEPKGTIVPCVRLNTSVAKELNTSDDLR